MSLGIQWNPHSRNRNTAKGENKANQSESSQQSRSGLIVTKNRLKSTKFRGHHITVFAKYSHVSRHV